MNVKLITKTSSNILIVSILILFVTSTGFAKKGGNGGGKPGGDDGDPCAGSTAMFPALIYANGRPDEGAFYDLFLASSDGCRKEMLPDPGKINAHNYLLQYPVGTNTGFYVWIDHPVSGTPRTIIWRQWIEMVTDGTDETLTFGATETIYTSDNNYVRSFDLREYNGKGSLVVHDGDELLVVEDVTSCSGVSTTCRLADGLVVYSATTGQCVSDTASGGECYEPLSPVFNTEADKIYLNISKEVQTAEGRLYAIADIYRNQLSVWEAPELLVGGNVYYEATAESISANGQWLSVNYLDIQKTQPSGHRILFLDLSQRLSNWNPNEPTVPTLPGQNMMYWHTSWITDDTVLMLGTEGKRRNQTHPVFKVNPFTGESQKLEVSSADGGHVGIDSNL